MKFVFLFVLVVLWVLAVIALGMDLMNGGIGDCDDDLLWFGSCR